MINFQPVHAIVAQATIIVGSLLLFGELAQAQSANGSSTTQWPRFLGANIDGKSSETGILKDWSGDKLRLLWKVDSGQGYGIGSVAGGKYFHFDLPKLGIARLRCIDIDDGKTSWEFKYDSTYIDMYNYDAGPRASPLVDGDRIYVFGVEGMLYCLDVANGKEVWKVDTSKKFGVIQNFFGVASCPVMHEDLLLVMIGGSPEGFKMPHGQLNLVQPNNSGIVAFDKKTGEVRYKIGDDLASYSSLKIVEIGDELTGLAWMRGALIGFRPSDGEIKWKFPWRAKLLESVNASTPVVFENKILLSECYEIGSVLLQVNPELAGGETSDRVIELWSDKGKRKQAMAAHWNTPVLHEGYLYGCSGRHKGSAEFRCVELATGKVMWSEKGLSRTSATFCDGHLIVMGEIGDLFLLKANPEKFDLVTTYSGRDKVNFTSPCWAAPIVADGKMFTRGKRTVACFELKPNAN